MWEAQVMPTRPATYRRQGPDALPRSLHRLLDGASAAVNRGLRSRRAWSVVAAAAVPAAVGLVAARRRIGLHPAGTRGPVWAALLPAADARGARRVDAAGSPPAGGGDGGADPLRHRRRPRRAAGPAAP